MSFKDGNYEEDLGYRDSKEKRKDDCQGTCLIIMIIIFVIAVLYIML